MLLAAGEVIGGAYRVLREIGRGGMGVVYEAEDLGLGRRVALKVAAPGLGDVAQRRLLREARAAARLVSPHVARVHRADALPDGTTYVVSELLEGESLDVLLAREGPLSAEHAVSLLSGALEGLAEAHRHGLVHRDVKPANLFVVRGAEPRVKLLDFGFVSDRVADTLGLTKTHEAVGTSHYMAPEQRAGTREVDARADVWAAGVTLYELLTGRRPPDASAIPALLRARADVPAPLAAVVARCLEPDPAARFADASALREALVASAGAATSPRRRAAERRRRPLVALALVALTTFVIGLAAVAFLFARSPPPGPVIEEPRAPIAVPEGVPDAEIAPIVVAEVRDADPAPQVKPLRRAAKGRPASGAASESPLLPKCVCALTSTWFLCRAFRDPRCSCWTLRDHGHRCLVPYDDAGTCPAPTVALPLSKHQQPCTGFARDGRSEPGTYACSACDHEYGPGRTGEPCEGVSETEPQDGPRKGTLRCY